MTDVTANNEPFDYASLEWLLRFHEATEPVTTIGLLLQWILLQIRYNAAPFRLEGLRRNGPNIHLLLGEPPAEDRDRILAPCAVDPRDYPRGVLEAALLHNAGLEAMMYLTPLVERFFSVAFFAYLDPLSVEEIRVRVQRRSLRTTASRQVPAADDHYVHKVTMLMRDTADLVIFCVDTAGLQFGNRNPVYPWDDMEQELGYTVEEVHQFGACLSRAITPRNKLPRDRLLQRLEAREFNHSIMSRFEKFDLDLTLFALGQEVAALDEVMVRELMDRIDYIVERGALELGDPVRMQERQEEITEKLANVDEADTTPASAVDETATPQMPADTPEIEIATRAVVDLDSAESRNTFMEFVNSNIRKTG